MKISPVVAASAALTLAHAIPASANSGSATAGPLTVTLTVEDVTFTGPDCIYAPYRVDFSGPGAVEFEAYQQGSSNTLSGGFSYKYEAGTEIVDDGLFICPSLDGAGTYFIKGTVEGRNGNDASAPLPSDLSFVVSTASARMTGLKARQAGSKLTVKGRATAESDRGSIGVQSEVTLQGRLSKKAGGKGKWTTLGTAYPNQFGAFTFRGRTDQRLKGAEIRAVLTPSSWAGTASASTRVK